MSSLSSVVGSKWPSLAVSLSLSAEEIKDLKEKGARLSQEDLSFCMLTIWVAKENSTIGQLYHELKKITFFQKIIVTSTTPSSVPNFINY